MEKKEIKKNIENAVKIFRETLEATYLEKNRALYAIGIHTFNSLLTGQISETRKNNGNLKISGELAKVMFTKKLVGIPRELKDWAIYPLVVTLFNEDIGKEKK